MIFTYIVRFLFIVSTTCILHCIALALIACLDKENYILLIKLSRMIGKVGLVAGFLMGLIVLIFMGLGITITFNLQ